MVLFGQKLQCDAIWSLAGLVLAGVASLPVAAGGPELVLPTHAGSMPGDCTAARDFRVFDGTLFTDKPRMSDFGIETMPIIYVSRLWPDWHRGADRDKLPDRDHVLAVARDIAKHSDIVVIDIEHWDLRGSAGTVAESTDKLATIAAWVREAAPGIKLGYYAQPPAKDYTRSILRGRRSAAFRKWQGQNNRLAPLVDAVDILFPSFYARYKDQGQWAVVSMAHIDEARRLTDKPVYAFLWPLHPEQNRELGYKYISDEFWKKQLELIYEYADGVVVWGGWDPDKGKPARWDSYASWWTVLKEFMNEKSSKDENNYGCR